jgi:hypothetical protein
MSRPVASLALSVWVCWAVTAQAQSPGPASRPVDGERLSDWLLRQPPAPQAYPLGLMWLTPSERSDQTILEGELLHHLQHLPGVPDDSRARLLAMVNALPATGRVRLPKVDARWLQAHPQDDPVLRADHSLVLPPRPTTVSVLSSDGLRCTLPHQSGAQARDYLRACGRERARWVDRIWLVQADGRVSDFGVAPWNAQTQDEPAPGALLWAPSRLAPWATALAPRLTQFLATHSHEAVIAALAAQPSAELRTLPAPGHAPGHAPGPVAGPSPGPAARDAQLSANDWGLTGLLQTPTARMPPAGEVRFHFSRVQPYERSNVFVQPFDALELGFRYTNVLNRLYGPESLSGTQAYKDKSIDIKFRLLEESANLPQVAVGITDLGGTGLFSSEYLVANKRWGAWDASLGLAWGYLGAGGNLGTPLAKLDPRFKVRGAGVATGGTPNTTAYFRGPTALFGGVQYTSANGQWLWKAELDGNNYRHEPQGNVQKQRTPVNLGLVHRLNPAIDLTAGLERGNTVMVGVTLHTSVARMGAPKVSDPPTPRVLAARPSAEPNWLGTAADVSEMSGWGVRKITRDQDKLRVEIDNAGGAHWDERTERIAAVLHRDAPAGIEVFELVFVQQGVALSERRIDRQAWVSSQTALQEPTQRQPTITAQRPPATASNTETTAWERPASRFSYGLVPSFQQNIGGPDGFLLFRAGLAVPVGWKVAENVSLNGTLSLNILDNFDNFKYTAPSKLPRVRTYLREYMTNSRVNVSNLQLTHFDSLGADQYYSAYAGYLESMYGGLGGEWLYRPWHSPWALGVDINRVQQRNFDQGLGFDKAGSQTGYRQSTGHATLYWDTGWQSTQVKLSAGRYLAGDMGATLDLSRSFQNGVTMGAWATKTNVSAEKFGEGSFDKGLYLRIPFDVMTTSRSGNVANLVYSPLTRDGGARLNRSFTLYGASTARSLADTRFKPVP